MEHKDSLLEVVKTLFKWKRPIILVCLVAAVGSAVISLLLPVYYKSSTTFLAASPDQAKPELLFGSGNLRTQYYGTDNDNDRILTIAESNELVEFLIDTFNLYTHYDIDTTSPRAPYWVKQAFFEFYEIKKTKRDALELSIEDRDPEMAALIVNAGREKINEIAQRLLKESQYKTIQTFDNTIQTKEKQLVAISDSLLLLRKKYGIYNTEAQTEALTDQFSQAEAKLIRNQARLGALRETSGIDKDTIALIAATVKGMEKEVSSLENKIGMLNDGMAIVSIYEKQYLEANQKLSEDRERRKQYIAAYNSNIPAIYLIEEGAVAIIKSRPRRSLLVVAATAIAFLFCVLGVLLFDSYKTVNWKDVFNGK